MAYEFGNDPAKIENYRRFWQREPVKRPMVSFTLLTFLPLDEFKVSAAWPKEMELLPEHVHPDEFLDDWEELIREGEFMDDDVIRGVSPVQSIFWCCGTLGCRMRVLPGNIVAVDQSLPWEQVLDKPVNLEHPWFRKYLDFIDALVKRSNGRYPVSHGTLVGPLDYAVALRGHEQTVIDMVEEPENAEKFMQQMGDIFIAFTKAAWERIPLWHNGYFDAQYKIWSPGSIARMQEDAIAVMSPQLYREFIQPVDRRIASTFDNPFMHLHATSMIVLDDLLDVKEIKAFEINHDIGGPPIEWLIPHLQKVQAAGRPLKLRGIFTEDEARKVVDALDPAGLYITFMLDKKEQAEPFRKIVGM